MSNATIRLTAETRSWLKSQIDLATREAIARPSKVTFCGKCHWPYEKDHRCGATARKLRSAEDRRRYDREYKRLWRAAQRGTPARAGRAA